MVFVNTAAFAREASVRGIGRASSANAKTAVMATRRMGVLKEIKFTLFIISGVLGLFVVVHDVGQFRALFLHGKQRSKGGDCTGKILRT